MGGVLTSALSSSLAQVRDKRHGWKELYQLHQVSATELYVNRLSYNLLANIGFLLLFALILGVIIYFTGGYGEGQYPILYYYGSDSSRMKAEGGGLISYDGTFNQFLPLIMYVKNGFYVLLAEVIFLQAFMSLLSIKTRSHLRLVVGLLISCLGLAYLSYRFAHVQWLVYTPFIHLVQPEIFDGWLSSQTSQPLYETSFSALILLAWSIIFSIVGYVAVKYNERKQVTL